MYRVNLDTVRADYYCLNKILLSTVKGNAFRWTENAEKSLYRWRARRSLSKDGERGEVSLKMEESAE